LFVNLYIGHERIVYFDSYAHKPEREIIELMVRWMENYKCITGLEIPLYYNSLRHQYKNSDYQYIRRFSTHRIERHVAKGADENL